MDEPSRPDNPDGFAAAGPDVIAPGEGELIVNLEGFEGPLDLLLTLIQRASLDITVVALAAVTDAFLRYLEALAAVVGADCIDGIDDLRVALAARALRDVVIALLDDDRIEKAPDFSDHRFEFSNVGLGQIPLIGGWLDQIDRQRRQDKPPAAVRFSIHRQHSTTVVHDRAMQSRNIGGRRSGLQFRSPKTGRYASRFPATLHTAGATRLGLFHSGHIEHGMRAGPEKKRGGARN